MNGHCNGCIYNAVCDYPYKPTECRDFMKFRLHSDAIECNACEGSGYKPYPTLCSTCKGATWTIPIKEANQ